MTIPTTTIPSGAAGEDPDGAEQGISSTRVEWAPVPKVNLLPPETLDARRFRKTQRLLVVLVAAVVLLLAGATFWSQLGVDDARASLEATQSRTTLLRAQEARYAEVPALLAQVETARSAREQAMARDVLWYRFLSDVALSVPAGVWLDGVSVQLLRDGGGSLAGASTGGAPAKADVLSPDGIGQVSFTGKANTMPDVAAWLDAVGEITGVDASTLKTATRTDDGAAAGSAEERAPLTFTTTVTVTEKALSHRFDRKAG